MALQQATIQLIQAVVLNNPNNIRSFLAFIFLSQRSGICRIAMSKYKVLVVLLFLGGCSKANNPEKVIEPTTWVEEYNAKHSGAVSGKWTVSAYDPNQPLLSLKGKLDMQSPKEFHLLLSSWLSREVEVWSDAKQFKFWSKKYDQVFVYAHDQPNNLKGVFQPVFLEAILTPPKISDNFLEGGEYWIVATNHGRFRRLLYIDKRNLHLDWVILTENNEVVVAGKREGGSPPSKVTIDWKEEDRVSVWEIH